MELGFADGKRTTVQIPEYEQRTTIHPLYGVRHESGQTFIFDMPFNTDARPQKFKAWMNSKVLQIDDVTFTAKDLLREIANNEGAHLGESKKLSMPDASSLTFDNVKNQRYKAVNTVKFGGPILRTELCHMHRTIYCRPFQNDTRSSPIFGTQ